MMNIKKLKIFKTALFLSTALALTGCGAHDGIDINNFEIGNWFDDNDDEDTIEMKPLSEYIKTSTPSAIEDTDELEDDNEGYYFVETDENMYDLDDLYLIDISKIYPNEKKAYYLVKETYRNLVVDGKKCTIIRSKKANDKEKITNTTEKSYAPYIDNYLSWIAKNKKIKKEFILDSIYTTVGSKDKRQFIKIEWFKNNSSNPGILQISDMKDETSGLFMTLDSCKLSKNSKNLKDYVDFSEKAPMQVSLLVDDDSKVVRFYYSLDEVVKMLKKSGYKNIKVDSNKVKSLKK